MASVGFTGTRKGMTLAQEALVIDILKSEDFTEYHHGDCVGADKQFHKLITDKYKRSGMYYGTHSTSFPIIVHPPDNDKHRAFCKEGKILKPKPYLKRNKDIVDSCDLLIACPNPKDEINKLRSGTWSTIRYAKKQGKDIIIIM